MSETRPLRLREVRCWDAEHDVVVVGQGVAAGAAAIEAARAGADRVVLERMTRGAGVGSLRPKTRRDASAPCPTSPTAGRSPRSPAVGQREGRRRGATFTVLYGTTDLATACYEGTIRDRLDLEPAQVIGATRASCC